MIVNKDFPVLSISNLLSSEAYIIPRYQRNYAWTEEHIKQLIDDIIDNTNRNNDKPYYLGTLVVFPRESPSDNVSYEIIDGQQRFTTLTLLTSYLKNEIELDSNLFNEEQVNLDFESRSRSAITLKAAFEGEFHDSKPNTIKNEIYASEIIEGYKIIQRVLPQQLKNKSIELKNFINYFFKKVQICRVSVPMDTDLNHYFEIMNNRGEQLEKHEVLKARLLNDLTDEKDRYVFNLIWEACSSMERYIQYEFSTELRKIIFGQSWDTFQYENPDELFQDLRLNIDSNTNKGEDAVLNNTLTGLIENEKRININEDNKPNEDEDEDRFIPIINFSNFLLHALSIYLNKNQSLEIIDIPLEDNQLLNSFEIIRKNEKQIKEFGFALLKLRFLFDQNIIKRDIFEDDRHWSLLKLYETKEGNPSYKQPFEQDHQEIVLLQSMFHVSVPSRPYKYWLQGTLRYLYNTDSFNEHDFKNALFDLVKAFVYDRFLVSSSLNYDEIIFKNNGKPIPKDLKIEEEKTLYGNIQNILLFNYIDYLLWLSHKEENPKIKNFVFTFRSSVEHYYPQNPRGGDRIEDKRILNSLGNLCLISQSKNSQLRDNLPLSKAEYYFKQLHIDSILQHKMLEKANEWSQNTEEAIKKNEEMLFELLKSYHL